MTNLKIISENLTNLGSSKTASIKHPYILAVAAGKGGVGKSTVSVNLALAFRELGLKVGLMDADVYGPSLVQMLPRGLEPVENPDQPEKLFPALSFGLSFISVAHFKKKGSLVRAPIANRIIEHFLEIVEWGDLDYLIIDFPPGTGDIQLTLMQKAAISAALLVTTPQIVSTLDVAKAAESFQTMQIPILGVIENMSFWKEEEKIWFPFGKGGGEDIAKNFSIPLLGQIPIDSKISEAADQGISLLEHFPDSIGSLTFKRIGKRVFEELQRQNSEHIPIRKRDSFHLEILLEGVWISLSAEKLQENCPCARCTATKKTKLEGVSLLEFSPLGRYAIQLKFSKGCSQGIYPYSLLKKLSLK